MRTRDELVRELKALRQQQKRPWPDWLGDLKAGDTLFYVRGGNGWPIASTVRRRTPTGQIVLDNGDRFHPDGKLVGRDAWAWAELYPYDETVEREIRAFTYLSTIKDHLHLLPLEEIEQLYEKLKPTRK